MQTALKAKLSCFMFLQYFIWGSWYVSLSAYLGKTLNFAGAEIGACYGAFAIGAIFSPFIVGLIADRYFASEKLLGILGILGGLVMLSLPRFTTFASLYPMLILYCLLYVPTLALGNSLSLTHLADSKNDFPRVKMLSAVGWIAGLFTLSMIKGELSPIQFYLAGGVSILFGVFSFTLPHTPPTKTGANVSVREILGLDALGLLRQPSFAIFIACMFLICIPLYFYFVMLGSYLASLNWSNMAVKTSLAQVSDVIFLFLLPVMLRKFGYKKTILIGILAWVSRYFLLWGSVGTVEAQTLLIFAAILVHGVCYDFLFIAGQLYVDEQAGERTRGAAQGFIAFILWGVGNFVGTYLAGKTLAANETLVGKTPIYDWQTIWMTPALGACAVLVIFLVFFREPKPRT